MTQKSIIIIGGGIAGLSAGCYGQMNGYKTQIFELHTLPGGLCTAWGRKGYTFDGCIHWLVGSGQSSGYRRIWDELGALAGCEVVNHDEFMRIQKADGKAFILYTNVDRLEQHLLDLAPADEKPIREFTDAVRLFSRFDPPVGKAKETSNFVDMFKTMPGMMPIMPAMMKWGKVSIADYAERFSDPFLRYAFGASFGNNLNRLPVLTLMMTLAWMHRQDAGYPVGGSLEFSRGIERRYLSLGGEIHYKSRVEKILVEAAPNGKGDRAVGIRLTDGSEHRADVIISAADGRATIFDMLEGRYADDTIRGYYEKLPIFSPIVMVSLGVGRDLSAEPHSVSYVLDKPVTIAGEARTLLPVKHYCYDPTMAPAGKSVVMVMVNSSHKYWKELAADSERYESEKQQAAITVIEQLDRRYPGLAGQVEVVDVATPLTFERYTGNWQGSIEGWMPTVDTGDLMWKGMSKSLPGLSNFYMVGQWVEPGGGLPPAATSGRNVIQILCKQDKRRFVASAAG